MARDLYGTDIYRQGQQVPTAAGGNDPTVSISRGVNIESLAGLVDIPLLDPRGAVAMGRGYAALGEGIGAAGANLEKAMAQQEKALGIKRVTENENEMKALAGKIAVEQAKERDELEWEPIAVKHMGALSPLRDDLAPDVRDHITARRGAWSLELLNNTKLHSARKSVRDADSDMDMLRLDAEAQGDVPRADAIARDQEENGARPKGWASFAATQHREAAERLQKNKEARHENAAIETAVQLANTDPDQAAETVNHPDFASIHRIKPTTATIIRNRVQAVQGDTFRAAQGDVLDAIVAGKDRDGNPVQTPEDVARVAGKRIRPHELKRLQDNLMEFHTEARKAEMSTPEKQKEIFGELLDRVAKFDREALGGVNSKAARDEYSDILSRTAWLDPVRRGEVTQPLSKKWFAGAPEIDATVKGYVKQSIQDFYDAGAFGQTEIRVPKVEGDEGFDKFKTTYKTVTDVAGQKAARSAMADAQIALNNWLDGELKVGRMVKREDATSAINAFAGRSLRREDAEAILEAARQKTAPPPPDFSAIRKKLEQPAPDSDATPKGSADPLHVTGDMPDQPAGQPDPDLLPPRTPEEQAADAAEQQAIDEENERLEKQRKKK